MTEIIAQAFNEKLIVSGVVLGIRAYLKKLNDEVFKQPIDEFVDDLLDLVVRDDFCIPHDKLIKYGVLKNESSLSHTARLLEQYSFVEGHDFSTMMDRSTGGRPAKMYFLRPETFEHCLMRARNTNKYAKFYSLLRKCVTLFDKYQIAFRDRTNMLLSLQNAELMRTLAEMRAESKQTGANVCEIKTGLHTVNVKVDALQGGIAEIKTQLDTVAAVDKLNKLYICPVNNAKLAGAATKARVATNRANVKIATTAAGRVVTRVTTTTVTETVKLADEELDAILDELLN